MKAKRVGDVLAQVLRKGGLERGIKRGQVVALWPQIAGPALADLTEAERLEDGVLFVRVNDAVLNHQLTYMREGFLQRYHEQLPKMVKEIRFQVGQTERKTKSKAAKPKPATLSSEDESQARVWAEGMPQDLQGVVYKAARAVKQRQKSNPHPPCVICGLSQPQSPCTHCQKLLLDPLVVREAGRLTRFPLKSRLEGDPLQAARYLAQSKLEGQLRELLQQTIQQPDLLPILQDTARRYLQLRSGQKQVAAYRSLLPETLQSLLKEL